jgi:hypothetical protein
MKITGHGRSGERNQPVVIGAESNFKRSTDQILCPECGSHFQSSSFNVPMTCPSCKATGFQFPDNVPTCPGCGTRGLCAIIDGVHWKLWVPFPPEVMQKFWVQWNESREGGNDNFGAPSSAERVHDHISKLSEWINRKPNTIRYMNPEELAALQKKILDALVAFGSTRERAEELTANLPTVGERLDTHTHGRDVEDQNAAVASMPTQLENEFNVPYLDKNGDRVIPSDCPKKYRWWQGGQTIAETRAELTKHHKK